MQTIPNQFNLNIIYFLIVLFTVLMVLLLIVIFAQRALAKLKSKKKSNLRILIQYALNHYLFSGEHALSHIVSGYLPEFFKPFELRNKLYCELLILEMMNLKANISGEIESRITDLYKALKLYKLSNKKLLSNKWHIKIQGIREIASMDIKEAVKNLGFFVNDNNAEVRMESMVALVQLVKFKGLMFVLSSDKNITEWHQINIINILAKSREKIIPDFSEFLMSRNPSVVSMAIKLVVYYKQTESAPKLVSLLKHKNMLIQNQAIEAIEKLNITDYNNILKNQYFRLDKYTREHIIKSFKSLAKEDDIDFLAGQLGNYEYEINLASSIALVSLGDKGIEALEKIYIKTDKRIKDIIKHALDMRLN